MKFSQFGLLLFLLIFLAFGPKEKDPVEKLIGSLQKWTETNPQEKVYLHTDKPYYVVGDTIWFKAYVTIGAMHNLSAKSGALYVELVNEKDSVAELLKLPVTAGMAKGCFSLSELLREGNYRLRAYTQWMRNTGPEYFYDRVFVVSNPVENMLYTKVKYSFSKDEKGDILTAVLNYTDSMGEPYSDRKVKYNLRRRYRTIASGNGVTDANGDLKLKLKYYKIEDLSASHLTTGIELESNDVLYKTFPIKTTHSQNDIQFFPEGGQVVNGLLTKVAFKAIGIDGLGIPVKGTVTDHENNVVASFESRRFGMGYFMLKPEKGKCYKAQLIYQDGSTNVVELPEALYNGFAIGLNYKPEADSVMVKLQGTLPIKSFTGAVYLVAHAGGEVYFSANVPIRKLPLSLALSAKDIPSGITQFTLFSPSGAPINERIVFIQHDDQMSVNIGAAKNVFGQREKVDLNLNAKNPDGSSSIANFSIAVTNEDIVPVNELKETTIFSQLLLSADIKGYVEQPNYYFSNPSAETRENLDILMLTQGYRRFRWKDLLLEKSVPNRYESESLNTVIKGKLINLWGMKVKYGKVILMNNSLNLVLVASTDKEGYFKFDNLVITEGVRFSLQGRKAHNGTRLEVLLNRPHFQQMTPNLNLEDVNTEIRKVSATKKGVVNANQPEYVPSVSEGRRLKEVNILAKPKEINYMAKLKGQIDQTIVFNELDSGKTVFNCLRKRDLGDVTIVNQSEGCATTNAYAGQVKMDIYVNDKKIDPCDAIDLFFMDPIDVIKIDIVRSNRLATPSLLFYIRSKFVPGDWNPSMINILPRGFDKVKEFYSPKYAFPLNTSLKKDLRTTIYWNPSVRVQDGGAMISYYNGDRKGNYRVVVEGINAGGLLGRQIYRYKIE